MTILIVLGIGILFSYPFMVGAPPKKNDSLKVRKEYALRLTIFFGAVSVVMLGAATAGYFMTRRIRDEFADRSLRNFATLITPAPKPKQDDDSA
ncbi:MAG TPA: hypothetical protein VFG65_04205 [Fimbriimonadales bacterium]|jgi:hypothetical protein|nr:hypothetical protein [Fimbriimonadales bacterium]